jgi:hypothetical protein
LSTTGACGESLVRNRDCPGRRFIPLTRIVMTPCGSARGTVSPVAMDSPLSLLSDRPANDVVSLNGTIYVAEGDAGIGLLRPAYASAVAFLKCTSRGRCTRIPVRRLPRPLAGRVRPIVGRHGPRGNEDRGRTALFEGDTVSQAQRPACPMPAIRCCLTRRPGIRIRGPERISVLFRRGG